VPGAPDIIIPRHVPIATPRKQIKCATGNARMNCGNCGCYEFGVHVRPDQGTARVAELICLRCGRAYKTDPQGRLGGGNFKRSETNDG